MDAMINTPRGQAQPFFLQPLNQILQSIKDFVSSAYIRWADSLGSPPHELPGAIPQELCCFLRREVFSHVISPFIYVDMLSVRNDTKIDRIFRKYHRALHPA